MSASLEGGTSRLTAQIYRLVPGPVQADVLVSLQLLRDVFWSKPLFFNHACLNLTLNSKP